MFERNRRVSLLNRYVIAYIMGRQLDLLYANYWREPTVEIYKIKSLCKLNVEQKNRRYKLICQRFKSTPQNYYSTSTLHFSCCEIK